MMSLQINFAHFSPNIETCDQLLDGARKLSDQSNRPGVLKRIYTQARDLGVSDLAEQHDHYLYGSEKK